MLPDAEQRLAKAQRELEELVERSEAGNESDELREARAVLGNEH